MSSIEHYFENLLFKGQDVAGELNKRNLTAEQIRAVDTCASYVIYTIFCGRENFLKFIEEQAN